MDNLKAALADLSARGVPIAVRTETSNRRMAAINDTEGNLVFLHQRRTG